MSNPLFLTYFGRACCSREFGNEVKKALENLKPLYPKNLGNISIMFTMP